MHPTLDFETYSEAGYCIDPFTLKVCGVGSQGKGGLEEVGIAVYAEHPSTEVLVLKYDMRDGVGMQTWRPGEPLPRRLLDHVHAGGSVAAWNVTFEWYIFNYVCVKKYGFPRLRIDQCHCDMAKSRRYSTPGSLDKAASVLGGAPKDKAGKDLIRKLCRPHSPTKQRAGYRRTRETDPDDFNALDAYCEQDVIAEITTADKIPDLTPYERATWIADQRINARGVQVDAETLDAALDVLRQTEELFARRLYDITQGAVASVNAGAQFITWLASQGVYTDSMDADHVDALLARRDLPNAARDALKIRQAVGGANVKKLHKLKRQLNSDGRLRDQYTYCGADRTGRWASGGVQLQNLTGRGPSAKTCQMCGEIVGFDCAVEVLGGVGNCPTCGNEQWSSREEWSVNAAEYAIKAIRSRDLGRVMKTWGDPCLVLAGCLRALFTAKDGHTLISCDFSAIEAVVLACLSRCQWRIDVFNTHGKIYEMSASKISGVPFEEFAAYKKAHGQHHPLRKSLGKVAELACFTHNTQVLTKRGYVRIVEVKPTDQLWDGVEWVTSDGVIHKGKREVITLDGVGVTPEHPVSLNGSWKEARLLASSKNTLRQALATGSENLPSCATKIGTNAAARSVLALAVRSALSICLTSTAGSLRGVALAAVRKAARLTSNATLNMPKLCRTTSTAADYAIALAPQSAGATMPRIEGTQTTAAEGSRFAKSGASLKGHFSSTFRRSTGGATRGLKWTGSTPTATTRQAISDSSQNQKTAETSGQLSNCKNESTNSKDVYDIVNAGPRHRFTIKTDSGHLLVHNSGYGGWVGAWKAFGADEHFNSDDEIKTQIIAWRDASPEIVEFWGGQHRQVGPKPWDSIPELYGLEGAAVAAILNPGRCYAVHDISFGVSKDVLYCRLPSGRFLHYHAPRLDRCEDRFRRPSYQITFEGYNSNPTKGPMGWVRMETYGGRLAENVTQAVSADIQAEAMVRCERAGYNIVMHTHDELTAEVPIDSGKTLEEMTAIMIERPTWANWWPIRGAGWSGKRYRKD